MQKIIFNKLQLFNITATKLLQSIAVIQKLLQAIQATVATMIASSGQVNSSSSSSYYFDVAIKTSTFQLFQAFPLSLNVLAASRDVAASYTFSRSRYYSCFQLAKFAPAAINRPRKKVEYLVETLGNSTFEFYLLGQVELRRVIQRILVQSMVFS